MVGTGLSLPDKVCRSCPRRRDLTGPRIGWRNLRVEPVAAPELYAANLAIVACTAIVLGIDRQLSGGSALEGLP